MKFRDLVADVITRNQMGPYLRALMMEAIDGTKIGGYEVVVSNTEDASDTVSANQVEVDTDEKAVVITVL